MAEATITLDSKAWANFLSNVQNKLLNSSELIKTAFMTYGFKDIDDHFRQEQGPDGSWPKRSALTNLMYDLISSGKRSPPRGIAASAFRSSNKLLQLTGALRKSILPGNIKAKGKNAIIVFSNISSYSRVHDEGGARIPKRPFMWLSPTATENMARLILALLEKGG